jgi:PKD repeat protein
VVGAFHDAGRFDTHTAMVFWSDGSQSPGAVVEADGQGTVTASHTYADNGVYVVRIEVTDDAGDTGAGEADAAIANVAPSVVAAVTQPAVEGTSLAINVATFSDPGFSNVAAGTTETFEATIDWGDGEVTPGVIIDLAPGSVGVATTGAVSGQHTYADEGVYEVTVLVNDDDGGVGTATFTITVENAAPVVADPADVAADEGEAVEFTASFSDLGVLDTHTAVIHWGDGSSSEAVVTETEGAGTASAFHTYADNGAYTILVEITDNGDDVGSGEATANIANVAPDLTAAADQRVHAGANVSFQLGAFTDPGFTNTAAGTQETFTATIN